MVREHDDTARKTWRKHQEVDMRKPAIPLTLLLGASLLAGTAQAEITLDVLYAFPNNYREVQEEIATRFEAEHPDIKIDYRNPAPNYDDASSQVLRDALVGKVPDVFFTGGNYMRVLASRDLTVPLDAFVASRSDWEKLGYLDSTLSLAQHAGAVHGLPFAISLPVLYVNADLVEAAGASVANLPRNWKDMAVLGRAIAAQGDDIVGFYHDYGGAGNFNFQVMVNSDGGVMGSADGCSVSFDEPAGLAALETFEMLYEEGMPDLSQNQIRSAFAAGKVGIWMSSTSKIAQMEKVSVGKFDFTVLPYPLASEQGRLPAGGAIAVMLTKDPAKQAAAWEFIKFATGPVGQTLVATYTGYMPSNQKAIDTPELLGRFYEENPNKLVGVEQLPVLTGWYNWAGGNSVKIVDVIQDHVDSVVFGKRSAAETMPEMTREVEALLADACN